MSGDCLWRVVLCMSCVCAMACSGAEEGRVTAHPFSSWAATRMIAFDDFEAPLTGTDLDRFHYRRHVPHCRVLSANVRSSSSKGCYAGPPIKSRRTPGSTSFGFGPRFSVWQS